MDGKDPVVNTYINTIQIFPKAIVFYFHVQCRVSTVPRKLCIENIFAREGRRGVRHGLI